MATLPRSKNEQIAFFEQRLPLWNANAAALGLSLPHLTELATQTTTARTDYDAAQVARSASLAATETQNFAVAGLTDFGADLIKLIRAKAQADNDPGLYALANIPAPAAPTPAGTPPVPTNLQADLQNDGSVKLNWKGTLSSGAFFTIWRTTDNAPTPTQIDSIAAKAYIDDSIPAATCAISYFIRAHRQQFMSDASTPVNIALGGTGTAGSIGTTTTSLAA